MDVEKKIMSDYYKLIVSIDHQWSPFDFMLLLNSISGLYTFYHEIERGLDIKDSDENSKILFGSIQNTPSYSFRKSNSLLDGFLSLDYTIKTGKTIPYYNFKTARAIQLLQIKYSSPGQTDFLGLGSIINTLSEVLFYYFPNKKNREEVEILKQERIRKQIENLERIGFSQTEIKAALLHEEIAVSNLGDLISEGKIKSIEIKKK